MAVASPCLLSPSPTARLPVIEWFALSISATYLETVLYGRSDGSSGQIWKAMHTAGIGSTTTVVNKAAVTAGIITEAEYTALMDALKSALPADVVDPCSLGRIRNCTILPFGRAPASMAWLHALSQPAPQAWELRVEQEIILRHGFVCRGVVWMHGRVDACALLAGSRHLDQQKRKG